MRIRHHIQRIRNKSITALIVLCLCLLPSYLQPLGKASKSTVIKDVRIFDGKEIFPSGTVVINDGKIVQVGKDVSIPGGAEILNGQGYTLLPGFFDCHTHVWTAQNLQQSLQAVEAGVDGLAHLFFTNDHDPNFGRLAAGQKTFVIPTLTVVHGADLGSDKGTGISEDPYLQPLLMPNDFILLQLALPFSSKDGSYPAAQKALRQLKMENVPILSGTDAPNPGTTYGASLHHELELLVESGMTPTEALRSATSIPADVFDLQDRGRIKPGYLADLVLVEGDPTLDIKNSRRIVQVWRAGVSVDLAKYRKSVEMAKEQFENQREAPPPKNFGSERISDFEEEKITANFGAGWSVSTDAEYRNFLFLLAANLSQFSSISTH